jgi:GNAT superfamily N-acetyltransferase
MTTAVESIILSIALVDDCAALCPLYWAFHEFHVARLPDRLRSLGPADQYDCATLQDTLTQLVIRTDADLVVARTPAGVIGFGEVHLRQDEEHPTRHSYRHGHLTALFVEGAYRGHGVGAGLIQVAEGWARQRGASEMRLEVWEYADSPQPFYEQVGYRTLHRTLAKAIDHP